MAMKSVVGSRTSAELWLNLQAKFAAPDRQNILELKENLAQIKKGDDSIELFLEKIKTARDALTTVGATVDDEDLILTVLRGLPAEYGHAKLFLKNKLKCSIGELKSLLKGAEFDLLDAQRATSLLPFTAMMAKSSNSVSPPVVPPGFGVSQGKIFQKGGGFRSNSSEVNLEQASGNSQLCKQPGHIAKTCPTLAKFQSHKPPARRIECQHCGRPFHTADKCYHLISFPNQQQEPIENQPSEDATAMIATAVTSNANAPTIWLLDSGASHHMTNDIHMLHNVVSYPTTDGVIIGNGEKMFVSHYGKSNIGTLSLDHVLLIPQLAANLLSPYQLCKDNKCRLILDKFECVVQDKAQGNIPFQGLCKNGLYPIPSDLSASAISITSEQSPTSFPSGQVSSSLPQSVGYSYAMLGKKIKHSLWHQRLGHPVNDITATMLKKA
ncbi:hypothetical protein Dimus_038280 [Dionaea muscipula]